MTAVTVAGALASKPFNGGEAWVRLSYVLGLRRLGVDVSFVEQVARPSARALSWFRFVVRAFGLRAALVDDAGTVRAGELQDGADLLVNVSGNLRLPRLLRRFRRRAYVDLDPGFTQAWQAAGAVRLLGHHTFFSVGENIGRRSCPIPVNSFRWRPTRPPVVLDEWPVVENAGFDRFTTVATWRAGHGAVTLDRRPYGLKHHAFRAVADLPERSTLRFEAALAIHPGDSGDLELLRERGWRVVDARRVAGDPAAFRAYVAGSGGEFSVAHEVYTATGSGWLSDRTARYLACGRPALVQDTGNRHVPVGEGLLTFRTVSEAQLLAARMAGDYDRHSRAARQLAREHFDSDLVLTRLLEDAL
jgi:hypothetical protein